MALITWNQSLETGVGMIDAQHRNLVGLINDLHRHLDGPDATATVSRTLDELKRYAVYHFSSEETYMRRIGFPGLEAHKLLHRDFEERLEDFEIDRLTGDPELAGELLHWMVDWLSEHIAVRDKAISK